MTHRIDLERLLFLLHGDRDLLEHLCDSGFLPRQVSEFDVEQAETARVAGTLVHELDVNYAGVEVVLRMRTELCATRHQIVELITALRERRARP